MGSDSGMSQAAQSPGKRRLAVLPLSNISPDPKDEFFSDGLTEELISTLSKIAGLAVIARTSVMRYRASTKPIRDIGRELDVATLLEGSVRRAGNKIRITVQLIDATNDEHLWSEVYDRDLEDVFAIQSEIAQRVARALKVQIRRAEKAGIERKPTQVPEAYALYLQGRVSLNVRTEPSLRKAIELFQAALARDPGFALAHTGLADAYAVLALLEFVPPKEAFPKARAAAAKALEIDEGLAEAHASLGLVRFQYDWEWSAAEAEFRRAIELNPNYPQAHQFYADYLKAMGRFDEAIAEMHRAMELDPLSLSISTGLGHVLYLSRQYDRAIEQYRKALELDPTFVQAHLWFGRPYLQKGMFQAAIDELTQAVTLSGASTVSLATLGQAYAAAGRTEEARETLTKLIDRTKAQYVPSYWISLVYTALGERDEAFTWLDKALQERSSWLAWIKVEPRFDGLRPDRRFAALLGRMRLDGGPTVAVPPSPAAGSADQAAAASLLVGLSDLTLSRFAVVGKYSRFEEPARNLLKDLRQKLVAAFESPAPKHENYLLWAPPGSGKTFFVKQVSDSLRPKVAYREVNLAETDEDGLRAALAELSQADGPVLCFIDEVDSKPGEPWPYEALLPILDGQVRPDRRLVFILAGSSGKDLADMERRMEARPKGTDLVSRIPQDNAYEIPAMSQGDRVLMVAANLCQAGRDLGRPVGEVEKLGLYYVALSPSLTSARQIREFALRCLERLPAGEDRVKFDHLFAPGDPQSKEFWMKARSAAPSLINSYVRIVE